MLLVLFSALCMTTTADRVVVTYYAPDPRIIAQAEDLMLASSGTVNFAGQVFTDSRLAAAMELAAMRGVSVNAVISPSGTSSKQYQLAVELVDAGGNVWFANVPNSIANRFFTVDSGTTATGTYKWSDTAVQVGAYLTVISGTNTTSRDDATFAALVATGTALCWTPRGGLSDPYVVEVQPEWTTTALLFQSTNGADSCTCATHTLARSESVQTGSCTTSPTSKANGFPLLRRLFAKRRQSRATNFSMSSPGRIRGTIFQRTSDTTVTRVRSDR